MGDLTARQREVPRQLRKLVRGAGEQGTRVVRVVQDGAREVHEITQWCTSLRSGARVCGVVHEFAEWCTSLRSGARARVVHDGARDYVVVHEIAEWCTMVHE